MIVCPRCECPARRESVDCPHCGATIRGADGRIAKTAAAVLLGLVTACGARDDLLSLTGGGDADGSGNTTNSGPGGAPNDDDGSDDDDGTGGFASKYGIAATAGAAPVGGADANGAGGASAFGGSDPTGGANSGGAANLGGQGEGGLASFYGVPGAPGLGDSEGRTD